MSKNGGNIGVRTILNFLWKEGDLRYKLDSLQLQILDTILEKMGDTKKICVLSSRQIGKSYGAVVLALMWMIRNPGGICRIIAPTKEATIEIVEDNLNEIIKDAPLGFITAFASKNRWNLFSGSSLRIGALERQFVNKNRGGNAGLIIYEECGFVKGDDFRYGVNSVLSPQLMRSKGHEVFITSPSEQPDHPIHTNIAPKCDTLGTLFNFMVFESPSISTSAILEAAERAGTEFTTAQVERIIQIAKKKGADFHHDDVHNYCASAGIFLSDDFRRELMAEVIRPKDSMVIPMWDERKTSLKFEPDSATNWNIVIDWGGVKDKTVALIMGYEFTTDTDVVLDERVFEPNTRTSEIVYKVRAMERDHGLEIKSRFADVSGQTRVDLLREHKYNVTPPQKTNWLASVNNMSNRFAVNRVRIHPRCTMLLATIRAGMFNKQRTDFERTEALGHCDALAALMYGIRSQDRSNPLPTSPLPDNRMLRVTKHEPSNLSAIAGKRFGKFKGKR